VRMGIVVVLEINSMQSLGKINELYVEICCSFITNDFSLPLLSHLGIIPCTLFFFLSCVDWLGAFINFVCSWRRVLDFFLHVQRVQKRRQKNLIKLKVHCLACRLLSAPGDSWYSPCQRRD